MGFEASCCVYYFSFLFRLALMEITNQMYFVDVNIHVDWVFNFETHSDLFVHSTASLFIFHDLPFPVTASSVINIQVYFLVSLKLLGCIKFFIFFRFYNEISLHHIREDTPGRFLRIKMFRII